MRIDCIDIEMLAPCGMNCMVCHKHCHTRKTQKLASAVRGKAKGDRNIVARQDKGLRAAERDYLLLSVWRLPL